MSGMGPAMDDVVALAVQAPAADPRAAAPAATPASKDAAATVVAPAATAPAAAVAPASTAPAATVAPAQPAAQARVTFPTRAPATTAHAGTATPPHAPATDAGSIGGAVFSLILVVALILALGWLAKRMPGMNRGGSSSQLKVVASVALGPRERAVVLDVGGRQLLVGVGQGGVRTLHTLEHPLPVVEPTAPSAFAQVLAQHFGRKS